MLSGDQWDGMGATPFWRTIHSALGGALSGSISGFDFGVHRFWVVGFDEESDGSRLRQSDREQW